MARGPGACRGINQTASFLASGVAATPAPSARLRNVWHGIIPRAAPRMTPRDPAGCKPPPAHSSVLFEGFERVCRACRLIPAVMANPG